MTVWLCPGQGAQEPGMGADLLEVEQVRSTFEIMSDVLEMDLVDLACNGSAEDVNDAEAAQALTMAVSVGVGVALKERGFAPSAIIGFSLGQISGLVLSEMLSLREASELLKVRSRSMAEACAVNPGGMVALMGATFEDASELCEQAAGDCVLVCANHNAPGQIVISGHDEALSRAQEIWRESKRKSVRLATAGAFHSKLMAPAAAEVRAFASTLEFREPAAQLICNTDAKPFDIGHAAERLGAQVESGVMFEQSVSALLEEGHSSFVEVGYGKVLTGLVRKIDKEAERANVGTFEQFEEYVGGAQHV